MPSEEYEDIVVRILLLDSYDRLLLLRGADGAWCAPGGPVTHGEQWDEAFRRLLWTATGLERSEGWTWVWTRRVPAIDSDGVEREHVERYYLLRTDPFELEPGALWQGEPVASPPEHRWWSPFEIEAATDVFAPRDLAARLEPLLTGRYPLDPIEVGP
jgi:ADP-ribose pyrophosphatase YjhB (NUDIX family)